MSYIKLKWDVVFNAAVEKQVEIEKWQAEWHEKRITRLMENTTGFLWWERKVTRQEAEQLHQEYVDEIHWVPRSKSLERAKKLQRVAIEASTQYEYDNDFAYLNADDVVFLFGEMDE